METYLNCKLTNTLSANSSIVNNERIDLYTVELKTDNTNDLLAGLQLQINELNGRNLELQNEKLELKEIIDALVIATLEG